MSRYEHCDYDEHHGHQKHDHEFTDSVKIAEIGEDPHNHRFAGISGQAIFTDKSHYHEIETRTDFYEDHFHEICVKSGLAVWVSEDKHVHYVCGKTTFVDGHKHEFAFATLIDNPIGD